MKINLSQHIMDYVTRFREVALPGIGLFRLVDTPAHFNGYSKLHPPTRKIAFTPDHIDTIGGFEYFVAGQANIDAATAQRAVMQLAKTITQSIVDNGYADLYPLGRLTQSEYGLQLSDKSSPFVKPLIGAQPLPLKLLIRNIASIDSLSSKSESDHVLKSPVTQPWRWITILLLALAMFLVFKTCMAMQQNSDQVSEVTSAKKDSPFTASAVDSTLFQNNTLDAEPLEVKNLEFSENENPVIKYEMGANNKHKASIDEVTPDAIDSLLNDPILSSSPPETPVECIIILGAFGQQRNAIRMMERIEAKGHQVYLGVHGNLTRVGIIFNCEKKDLVSYIQTIRKDFIRDAWYLQPQLRVDY